MHKETLLYGLPRDADPAETWKEDLLIARAGLSAHDIERVKDAASRDGWHSFRVAYFTPGGLPDFSGTVNAAR